MFSFNLDKYHISTGLENFMLLVEMLDTSEGDQYANHASAPTINEAKNKISAAEDPCWKGYHMVGTKTKSGREVPNCVPGKKGAMTEDQSMSDIIQARELVKQALRDPNQRYKYFDFLKHLRNKHGADYSTEIHQSLKNLDEDAWHTGDSDAWHSSNLDAWHDGQNAWHSDKE